MGIKRHTQARSHLKLRRMHKPRVHLKSGSTRELGVEGLKNASGSPSENQKAHMSQESMQESRGAYKLEIEGLESWGESPHKSRGSREYEREST
jgi:hypothetical protein